ncbi:MAG: aminopeptidase YwaD [Planctomycetota bacterium]|jgi:aminopeptidase YwaD
MPTSALSFLTTACLVLSGCASAGNIELTPEMRFGTVVFEDHKGPPVKLLPTGTYPFVQALLERFDKEGAKDLTAFIDGFYREPGNEGYNAVMERVEHLLRAAGFGSKPGLEIEIINEPLGHRAWTPRSASLRLMSRSGDETLLSFDAKNDLARTMLPSYSPSSNVRGPVCMDLDQLQEGQILVTDQPLGRAMRGAAKKGAAAVLSSWLPDFCIDPTGEERHLDAIRYGKVRPGTELPVAHISPRVLERVRAELKKDEDIQLHLRSDVEWHEHDVRTIIARIVGREHADQSVAVAAHVQEPGANDNASGVSGLVTGAVALAGLIDGGHIELPLRNLEMIWGDEMEMTRTYLKHTDHQVIAGFSSDMTGPSEERTGAICLLERSPDPGALVTLPPDEHTPWGAGRVKQEDLAPEGLALIARCALADVAVMTGGWKTADHPWEGGSDHDVFLSQDIPAALLWHFTDFAYHTNLDRLNHIDIEELRRTTAALLGAALAIADPEPADLDRYLESMQLARRVRLKAAEEAEDEVLAQQWRDWFIGSRHWLRTLCLDLPRDAEPEATDKENEDK